MEEKFDLGVWFTSVVSALVEFPDKVDLSEQKDDLGMLYTLHVADSDVRMIIGRQGKQISALRNILKAAGRKNGVNASLRIDDPRAE